MKALHMVTFILLVIGGLNWGLHALGYNVVEMVLGEDSTLTTLVYLLVGLAAIAEIFTHKKNCKACVSNVGPTM